MAFYDEMQAMVRDLLKPDTQGGLGQGVIKLTRITVGTAPNQWDPPIETVATEDVKAAVRGIDRRLVGTDVGSTVLLASDRQAVTEVPSMGYTAGDIMSVDGTPVMVISAEKIPAAGTTAAMKFIIRG